MEIFQLLTLLKLVRVGLLRLAHVIRRDAQLVRERRGLLASFHRRAPHA